MSKRKYILQNITLGLIILVTLVCLGFIGSVIGRDIRLSVIKSQEIDVSAQNVVLMIGDGMGFEHIEVTSDFFGKEMFMTSLEFNGEVQTHSKNMIIPTDSAAAATALATGQKVNNGVLAFCGEDIENISEIAKKQNKGVGIVCTETLSGATPAGFSAHTSHRSNVQEIRQDQYQSDIDIFLGAGLSEYSAEETQIVNSGYDFVTSFSDLSLDSEKIFGVFEDISNYENLDKTPTLEKLTEFAVSFLSNKYPNGFFLMVEGSHIDKKSHNNDIIGMIDCVNEFDKAVKKVSSMLDENTFVIVTADHETGGLNFDKDKDEISDSLYSSAGHTSRNVPYFMSGKITQMPKFMDNTDIFRAMKQCF